MNEKAGDLALFLNFLLAYQAAQDPRTLGPALFVSKSKTNSPWIDLYLIYISLYAIFTSDLIECQDR